MSEIGERIKRLRRHWGFTQKTFAQSMNISRSHIANLETGNTDPSDHLLSLMCYKFEINFEWLKYGTGPGPFEPPTRQDEREEHINSRFAVEQSSYFARLDRDLHTFLQIYNTIVNNLVDDLKVALKADPKFCNEPFCRRSALVKKLRDLMSKREGEPFIAVEKLLKRFDQSSEEMKS